MTTKPLEILLSIICMACLTACKDREKQYTYYDEGKTKPKEIYEIDKKTGLRDGLQEMYLESGALACSLEFDKGKLKSTSCEENTMVDLRDFQIYKTVKIGTQIWMAENLNYKTEMSNCYNNDTASCSKYGRLYKWDVALAACPNGWHLPTKAEFETLFDAVGGKEAAGRMLKSISGWRGDGNGTDAFGFSALPAGNYNHGSFYGDGRYANFWSSTENLSNDVYYMYLDYHYDVAYLESRYKNYGFSVRCLRD